MKQLFATLVLWVAGFRFAADRPRYHCLPSGPENITSVGNAYGLRRIVQHPTMITMLYDDMTYAADDMMLEVVCIEAYGGDREHWSSGVTSNDKALVELAPETLAGYGYVFTFEEDGTASAISEVHVSGAWSFERVP